MSGLPQEPQDCRRRAEACLDAGEEDQDVARAIAWGLLALVGELHEIRTLLRRGR